MIVVLTTNKLGIQQHGQRDKKNVCTVYDIFSDGRNFRFLRLGHEFDLQMSKQYWSVDKEERDTM